MDLSARGTKRRCTECEEAFYDLNRDPAPCPYCGHLHPLDVFNKGKRPPPEPDPEPEEADAESDDEDEDDEAIGDDDDDAIPDDDDLDDDGDDDIKKVAVSPDDDEDA